MVIHVELHKRDDAAEFRDEAPENAGFIHEPQNDFRVVAGSQDARETAGWLPGSRATSRRSA